MEGSKLDGGGPAFPFVELDNVDRMVYFGLTKREYFAGLAMQKLATGLGGPLTFKNDAKLAVAAADALIAELKKVEE
jgi:hypothetical protein